MKFFEDNFKNCKTQWKKTQKLKNFIIVHNSKISQQIKCIIKNKLVSSKKSLMKLQEHHHFLMRGEGG